MTYTLEHEPKTFGDWAYIAIAKHFNKILKHEPEVIQDTDPEELHQMRVGMRRLRSTIVGFAPALKLPEDAGEKQVGKVAKVLGKLRDIDVLEETLKNQYQPQLPHEEQQHLDQALKTLAKQRKKAFKKVKQILAHQNYIALKQSFYQWLNKPTYQDIAQISIHDILPDLLLPQVSKLMLHPGWCIGVTFDNGEIQFPDSLSKEEVETLLNNQGLVLHDLRKEGKRSRYNMELVTQFYGDVYQDYVKDIKDLQTVLGEIQDSFVLMGFLGSVFKNKLEQKVTVLSSQLLENRYLRWQEWEKLQRKFLNSKTRKDLHITVLQPILVKSGIDDSQNEVTNQSLEAGIDSSVLKW